MYQSKSQKAFSVLTALIVIIFMASIGSFVLNLSNKMLKTTTIQFQREQAMLLAKSYTEYAIMAVMANDRNATHTCLHTINADNILHHEKYGGFEVRVQIAYLSNQSEMLKSCQTTHIFATNIKSVASALNIIIDVYVKYHDIDASKKHWMTYHKRTLQKI